MRAVVLDADGQPSLAELPAPSGDGVHVRVRACGLCGSDVEKLGRAPAGLVLGHEVEGVLDDGTRVTVAHRVSCGTCERCRAGHESTCEEFRRLRMEPGGFAEELRATHVVPLPQDLPAGDGIWVEPLACVLRAARRVPRGRILVAGCGAIGQLWVQVLHRRGDDVVVTDPRAERLRRAHQLGASTAGGEVGAAVLTAPAALDEALRAVAPGGTLLVFAAHAEPVAVRLDDVYRNELTLAGSRSATLADFGEALDVLPELEVPEPTRLPLERFAEGVELYRRGDALKVVFEP